MFYLRGVCHLVSIEDHFKEGNTDSWNSGWKAVGVSPDTMLRELKQGTFFVGMGRFDTFGLDVGRVQTVKERRRKSG